MASVLIAGLDKLPIEDFAEIKSNAPSNRSTGRSKTIVPGLGSIQNKAPQFGVQSGFAVENEIESMPMIKLFRAHRMQDLDDVEKCKEFLAKKN